MSGGMLSGLSYKAAADFSFLMAIPIMCAASGYELLKNYKVILNGDWMFFLVGFIVSFVVAYIVVVVFLKYISKDSTASLCLLSSHHCILVLVLYPALISEKS